MKLIMALRVRHVLLKLVLIFSAALPISTFARIECEQLLESFSYRLSDSAKQSLKRLRVGRVKFDQMLQQSPRHLIDKGGLNYWFLIFEKNRGLRDRGLRIRGQFRGPTFEIAVIDQSNRDDESKFFHILADEHKVPSTRLALKTEMLGCREVHIDPWVRIKLELKHKFEESEIIEVLHRSFQEPVLDEMHARGGQLRYSILGLDSQNRVIRTILAKNQECPHSLVTSFEPDEFETKKLSTGHP